MNWMGYRWVQFRNQYNISSCYKIYGSKHTNNRKMAMLFNAVVLQHHNGHSSLSETQKYIGEMSWQDLKFLKDKMPEIGS